MTVIRVPGQPLLFPATIVPVTITDDDPRPDIPAPPDPSKVLVHNLDQEPSSSAVSLTATNEVAQVFRTGAASTRYILESIELAFNSYIPPTETGSPSKLSASVWSVNASGRPDTKQFDLSPPYEITAMDFVGPAGNQVIIGTMARFDAPANKVLNGDTTLYAVVLSYDDSSALFSTDEDAETSSAGYTLANAGFKKLRSAAWSAAESTQTLLMRVNGAANSPAVGALTVSAPNVFRVPAMLRADPSRITDANGPTEGIANIVTYTWQRFAADGATLEMDAIGAGETYTLTGADAGKKIKVAVSFTDDAGFSETRTSAAYPTTGTVTAAAVCTAPPAFTGGATQEWTGTVGVGTLLLGSFANAFHGFSGGSVRVEDVAIIPPGGGLPETTLSLGAGYTVNAAAVGANIRGGTDFSETLIFGTTVALTAAERAQLTLYVCDEPFLFSGGAIDGKLTKWTDTGLDWSDHAERTLTISRDQAAPTFMSARLVGTTLTLTFNEDLAAAAVLANTDFEVKKTPAGGTAADVTLSGPPAISGRTVSLTLSSAVADTDTVTVFYTKPTGTADKLVDKFGNETATFDTAKAVDLVLETDPPVFGTAALAADGRMLTLTYNEALNAASTPAAAAFEVKATPLGGVEVTDLAAMAVVSVAGSTVVLTLAKPLAHDDEAVTVTYTKPASGVIEDAAGNDAGPLTDEAVTNNSLAPRVTIAAVHPDATPGIANPVFRVIRSNTAAADLVVALTVTQAAEYLASTTQTITIPANATTAEKTFRSTLFDSNVSGDLTATVAGGDDHLPGVTDNAATVAMKLPAAGPIAALEYGQSQPGGGWSVVEGETLDVMLTATLAANVARPRTDNVFYALVTEADTATNNVDYTNTTRTISFPAAGWTGTGTGTDPYTQTGTYSVPTLQDAIYEGAEQFRVLVQAASGNPLSFPNSTVPVTLTDDETLMLTGISLTSTPTSGAYYLAGETISVTAAFNGAVTVDTTNGTPQFGLALGAAGSPALRQAAYASGSDTQALVFSYTVAAGDDDPDGVSWAADSLALGGGTVRFTSTEVAARVDAVLTHDAGTPMAAHKVDAVAPSFTSASVNGTALTMIFNEDLAAASALANSAFMVKKTPSGGTEADVNLSGTPAISGKTVSLTLAAAVTATDGSVTVKYTKPDAGSSNALADARGNAVVTFTDFELVTNVLGDTTVPGISTAVLAADGRALTLTYNEALNAASTPAATAFTVKATPLGGSEATDLAAMAVVSVAGSTVVLTLAKPLAHNDTSVTVAYMKPGSGAVIEDAAGNDAATFGDRAVTNNSLVPRVTIAAVHPDATPGIANPVFRVTRSNMDADNALTVALTVTQAAEYLASTTQTITIPANETTAEKTFESSLFDSNVSGDLTATVAGGDDHLPGVTGNAATVAMKLPAAGTGSIATLEYGQSQGGWSVVEGETLDVMVTLTTAADVARPRAELNYKLDIRAGTALVNVDYTDLSTDLAFPAAGWTGTGTGTDPYTQTVTVPVDTLEDTEYEGAEQFSVDVGAGVGNPLPLPDDRVPITLTDNETLMLTGISLTSTPASGAYYLAGETIRVTAAFNGNVTVDTSGGAPQFGLILGAAGSTTVRPAAYYASGSGRQSLVFSYTVAAGDDDPDGVSWAADSLALGGGTVRFTSTEVAARVDAVLTHDAGTPMAAHKVDAVAPSFTSASVNGTALTMIFNEDLAAAASLANDAFMVKKTPSGGTEADVNLSGTPAISGKTVSLTLVAAVTATDRNVTVKYTKPGTVSSNALADARGNAVVTFTDFELVTNVLGDTTAPGISTAALAADGRALTLTYNEALNAASTPAATAFTVKATPLGGSEATDLAAMAVVSVAGSTVVLTLAKPLAHNDTSVTVAYMKPGSGAVIEDAAGNDAATFGDRAVTNNSLVPRVTIAAVHPDATPGLANPVFRVIRSNTAAADLEVALTVTQAADYLASTTQTITIPANATTAAMTFPSSLFDSHVSGDLTLTVAGGEDHLPGVTGNAATVAMKLPATGAIVAPEYQDRWEVVEGDTLNFMLTLTTAADVARPRAAELVYVVRTEVYTDGVTDVDTAQLNIDFTSISENVSFPLADWTGSGPYTQTVTVPVVTLQDTDYEGAEQFSVIVRYSPGNPLFIPSGRVLVTLTDDETLMVTGISLTSTPTSGAYYLAGETIRVTAAFNGNVTVDTSGGAPQFGLILGAAGSTTVRPAAYYASGSGRQSLVFSYTVAAGDDDPDGVSWAADSLALGGGTVRFTSTEVAARVDAVLTHDAGTPMAAHKVDAVAPSFTSASVNGTALTMIFNEDLAAAASLANDAFMVKKTPSGGTEADVNLSGTPAISGKTVSLTLVAAVTATDRNVTVKYTKPGTVSSNALADARGNAVVTFTDFELVTNVLGDTTAPVLQTAEVNGRSLVLTYDDDLDTGSVPLAGDFGVSAAGQTVIVSVVTVSGKTVALTLARTVVNTDTVTVTYTAGSTPIQDLAGNDAADIPFPGRAVDNVTVSAPGAPGSLAAIPGNGQVGLGWAPPSVTGGAAIVRYEYRVSRAGGNNWSPDWTAVPDGPDTGSDAADERAYLVTGLTNGTAYTFQVRAVNMAGKQGAPAQDEATPQTGPAADPGAPRGFAARAGDATVTLSWRAPLDTGNRPLLRYEVRHAQGSTVPSSVSWQDVGTVLTSTVTGLTNGRQHTFEVRALNTAALAGAPARVQATPEVNADTPSMVRNLRAVVEAVAVRLYWHTPTREGLTAITHYEYRYARARSVPAGATWVRLADYTGTGVRLLDLDTGVEYTFEVRAVNATGPGARAQVRATPREPALRAPGAPDNLRAVAGEPYLARGNGIEVVARRAYVNVTLSWDPPTSDGNSRIWGYETREAEGGSIPAGAPWRAVEGELTATVRALTPGTRYTFEVRAVNGAGAGTAASRQLTTARYTGATVTLQAGGSAREGEPFTLRATRSGSTAPDTYVFFELYDSAFPNGYRGGTPYHHEVAYFNGATATATYTPPFDGTRAGRTFTVRISSVSGEYDISGGLVTVSVADRDAGLSVADASVREGVGATLEFVVRLDRARDGAVTVDYATSADTATAGLDYTEVSGTLSIPAGSRRASIEVPVLDDEINDDRETLTLTLSNADGAIIEDGVATGTIRNTDALPKAWLSRFGRSAAVQVVTLLDERFEAAAASDTRLVLGGRAVDVAALRTPAAGETGPRVQPDAGCAAETGAGECTASERAPLFGTAGAGPGRYEARAVRLDDQAGTFGQPGADMSAAPGEQAGPAEAAGEATLLERALWTLLTSRGRVQFDTRQFISQSSFDMSLENLGGGGPSAEPAQDCDECGVMQAPTFDGRWSLWGRGALMQFSGQDNSVNVSGDVLTGLLGVDYARDRWLAGAALAYHDGNGSYTSTRNSGTGDLDSVLVTVNPYLRYALTPRVSVWGTLGYGAGTLTLRQAAGEGAAAAIETDLRLGMGALGLRGVVYAGAHTELALKSDAMWVRTSSAETAGMRGAGADTSRIRLLLSGQHQRALANDALLSPGFELGLRYDDGDAETGLGLELSGGLRYADALRGLSIETKARALLAHEDGGYEEWGLSGSLSVDPGRLGRGLALRLDSGWGMADSGAEALWQRQTTAGIAPQHDSAAQRRVTAEMGYGLDVPYSHGILTPYSSVEWAGPGRTLRLGWRFVLGQRLSLSLDGERKETGHTPPEHALMLRTSLPW